MAEIPDELVQVASKALDERFTSGVNPVEWEETARIALQAAFAKLPECEEVVAVLIAGFKGSTQSPGTLAIRAARSLAREFGG